MMTATSSSLLQKNQIRRLIRPVDPAKPHSRQPSAPFPPRLITGCWTFRRRSISPRSMRRNDLKEQDARIACG